MSSIVVLVQYREYEYGLLVLTFLDSLSHDALRFNRKRETLNARISSKPYPNQE